MTRHLDRDTWSAFLAGTLDLADRDAVRRHLEEDCEACEGFLAAAGADALDGEVDTALIALAPPEPSDDEVGFARVRRRLARPRRALFGGAAVLAAAAGVMVLVSTEDPSWRLKGVADPVPPRLELLVTGEGGPVPLADGASLESGAVVVLRVHLAASGCVEVWQDEVRLTPQALCLPAGTHVLAEGGEALGLTLDDPGERAIRLEPGGAAVTVTVVP